MITHLARCSAGAALAVALLPQAARAIDVTDLLGRMQRAVEPGKDMRAEVELIISNESAERVQWSGHFYRLSGAKTRRRLVVESPLDLRGVCVGFERNGAGPDHVRIYLPSIGASGPSKPT